MKAAVLHGKEDLRIEDVAVPPLRPGEVRIRTKAALTCGTDVKVFRRGYHARMITPPALFGHEVAGVIEEVGPGVKGLRPGMSVASANSAPCGVCEYCRQGRESLCDDLLFWNGAYAETTCIPARIVERNLLPIPAGVAFEHAALVEPLACAVRGVAESGLEPGHSAAVIGVGPVGLMLIGLCAARGARVVAVGRRPERLMRAREFGAVDVVSTLETTAVEAIRAHGRGGHDVVIEAVGLPETSELALRVVRKGGTVTLFGGCPSGSTLPLDLPRVHYEEVRIHGTFHHTPRAVREAMRLIAARALPFERLFSGEAPLGDLPRLLCVLARGEGDLKIAIRPN